MIAESPTRTTSPRPTSPRTRAERFRRRLRAADLLLSASWTSAAAAVALYLAYGGAGLFNTVGDAVTSLGIIAGLIGTNLILLMLVLAARVPIIDRVFGHDRAMAAHRALGKPGFYLILAHGVLLILGYGITAGINPVAETIAIFGLPDMPLAFLGFGLLIVVIVTSIVVVRRRFKYEVWHVVHLLTYFAVIFALPHQFSVGGMLANGTFQRVYWIALYVIALGSIATFRFAEPIVKSIQHGIRVTRVEQVAEGVASIHLSGRNLSALGSAGGQFFVWRFWSGKTWWHSHPISLSAQPTDRTARITVRALGNGSSSLARLPKGTRVSFEGPYGLFTDAARTAPKLAIVAAGIGVTPVRALLEHSHLAPGEATILLRASTEDETYLWDEMEALATQQGARFYTSVGRRPKGRDTWLSSRDVSRNVRLGSVFPDLARSDLYVCGPQAWTDLVVGEARATGMPEHQIHTERFDW